ncbi:hypothetical protein FRX31_010567 [Thalictrum thalictroides]|uniref:Uncharacterized protein n=1 Tax=Thalictrum thalictroides TaxID=46969 RepID=A0A7J6WTP3_THATH|nr:hypothetical protein FRX31_010567 [Thalictrum thalictroides]
MHLFSRYPPCAGPLSKEMKTTRWTIVSLIRDSFSMLLVTWWYNKWIKGLCGSISLSVDHLLQYFHRFKLVWQGYCSSTSTTYLVIISCSSLIIIITTSRFTE